MTRRSLGGYVEIWFWFALTTDDFLNVFEFLFWRFGDAFLILKVSLAMLMFWDKTWAYYFFSCIEEFLKNFEISTTSFRDLAGINGGKMETVAALSVFLPLLETTFLERKELNWVLTLHLNKILVHNKIIPLRLIKSWDEPPGCFTNTFKVLDFVHFVVYDGFVKNIFLHPFERFLNRFDIRCKML